MAVTFTLHPQQDFSGRLGFCINNWLVDLNWFSRHSLDWMLFIFIHNEKAPASMQGNFTVVSLTPIDLLHNQSLKRKDVETSFLNSKDTKPSQVLVLHANHRSSFHILTQNHHGTIHKSLQVFRCWLDWKGWFAVLDHYRNILWFSSYLST